ncbi:iron-containing alcohol dehydrogenase [Paenibacillus hunanensis]|uniref:Alcohol dehydrogenase YqhD (Iron-dependent ADH family) n=1 Tax=Paenibacillus hunanensis TaxID=539262 RepID=A0ABU1IYJ5_9BACL|nr:iron-containing alcohol dehydrogenase [Paenibacillus hunanensis]MDR6244338.1 alcohol dehydrogenase YqhD (iron-dependent ADH family) [Paenibacillus hunanensis]GGJ17566.1 putative NADH-dependent butanol dehydrogenase 1 [Paenibacillus hunanensis]
MKSFEFYNPTRLIFGKGQLETLKREVPKYGKNVLLVYGGGSIKRSGLYDEVIAKLNEAGATVTELAGVEPNPRLTTVHKGVELCKTNHIDLVLAVGGGSVIDCAKAIIVGAKYDGDVWEIIERKAAATGALPLGVVLTMAATGSEMNSGSVITNMDTQEKLGWGSAYSFPSFSILDPEFTYSLPKDQTVYGIVDMMSHVLETYFHPEENTPVQDGSCESVLRAVIEAAPGLINDLENFELRSTIMYSGTMALNGVLSMGVTGDWATHNIEHAVSAVYDIPHGGGLAILFPNWMQYNLKVNPARFAKLAVNVFHVDPAGKSDEQVGEEGIQALRDFWTSIGAPSRLADYEIDDSQIDLMVEKTLKFGPSFGNFAKLKADDVREIYRMSL